MGFPDISDRHKHVEHPCRQLLPFFSEPSVVGRICIVVGPVRLLLYVEKPRREERVADLNSVASPRSRDLLLK